MSEVLSSPNTTVSKVPNLFKKRLEKLGIKVTVIT